MSTQPIPQPQTSTLAQAIRSKYPGSYDDLSDSDLEEKILAKYPQYSDMPRSAPNAGLAPGSPAPKVDMETSLAGDIPGLLNGLAKPTVSALSNPVMPGNVSVPQAQSAQPFNFMGAVKRMSLGNAASSTLQEAKSLNPVVTGQGAEGLGQTIGNFIMLASGLRKAAPSVAAMDVGPKAAAVGKVAAQDAFSRIPVIGRAVRRPSVSDYVEAAQTQRPPVYPGAPLPKYPDAVEGEYVESPAESEKPQPPVAQSSELPWNSYGRSLQSGPKPARPAFQIAQKASPTQLPETNPLPLQDEGPAQIIGTQQAEPSQIPDIPILKRYQQPIPTGLPDQLEDQAIVQRNREDLDAQERAGLKAEREPFDEALAWIDKSKRQAQAEYAAQQAYEKTMNPPVKFTRTVTPKPKVTNQFTSTQDLADALRRSIDMVRSTRAGK